MITRARASSYVRGSYVKPGGGYVPAPAVGEAAGNPYALDRRSVYLDGSSGESIYYPDSAALSPTDKLTVQAWVRPDGMPAAFQKKAIAAKYEAAGSQCSWRVFLQEFSGTTYLQVEASQTGSSSAPYCRWDISTLGLIADATWTHVTVTIDTSAGSIFSDQVQLYLDGVDQGSADFNNGSALASIKDSTAYLEWGAFDTALSGQTWKGHICGMRFWGGVVRTAEDIAADYAKSIDPASAGLVHYTPVSTLVEDTSDEDAGAALYVGGPLITTEVPFTETPVTPAREAVVWTAIVKAAASGPSGNTLTKTWASTVWDAGGVSTKEIAGDGYLEFTASDATSHKLAGLSYGDTDQYIDDVDFGIYLKNDGSILVEENLVVKYTGSPGAFVAGDIIRVQVAAGVVTYHHNGALLYTSVASPGGPLLVDTSIYTNGSDIKGAVLYGATTP